MQTMNIEERRKLAEPIEVLEDVLLDESIPENQDWDEYGGEDEVGFHWIPQKSTDVFAWSHENMPGIDPV